MMGYGEQGMSRRVHLRWVYIDLNEEVTFTPRTEVKVPSGEELSK